MFPVSTQRIPPSTPTSFLTLCNPRKRVEFRIATTGGTDPYHSRPTTAPDAFAIASSINRKQPLRRVTHASWPSDTLQHQMEFSSLKRRAGRSNPHASSLRDDLQSEISGSHTALLPLDQKTK